MIAEEYEREKREELFRDYVGQTLWIINTIQHLKTTTENEMPQYIELVHPGVRDTRTPDQIKQDVIRRLTS